MSSIRIQAALICTIIAGCGSDDTTKIKNLANDITQANSWFRAGSFNDGNLSGGGEFGSFGQLAGIEPSLNGVQQRYLKIDVDPVSGPVVIDHETWDVRQYETADSIIIISGTPAKPSNTYWGMLQDGRIDVEPDQGALKMVRAYMSTSSEEDRRAVHSAERMWFTYVGKKESGRGILVSSKGPHQTTRPSPQPVDAKDINSFVLTDLE